MRDIRFEFPELPISVNKLYFVHKGRKVLSGAGRAYKTRFITTCGGADPAEFAALEVDPESCYQLHLWFYIPYEDLYNFRYGRDKRVKSPFADMDVSNLVKLAEDCISDLVGIRDRNNFTVCAHKREGHPSLVAWLSPLDLLEDPFNESRVLGEASTGPG